MMIIIYFSNNVTFMKISITRVICGAVLNLNNVIKYIKFIKE